MQHNDLNIIIWNAKISAARSEFSARNWRMCKRFILNMIKEDIDLIGIIEINDESVIFIKTIFKRLNIPYDVANGTQSRGNTRFDTCLIYKKSRLAFCSPGQSVLCVLRFLTHFGFLRLKVRFMRWQVCLLH